MCERDGSGTLHEGRCEHAGGATRRGQDAQRRNCSAEHAISSAAAARAPATSVAISSKLASAPLPSPNATLISPTLGSSSRRGLHFQNLKYLQTMLAMEKSREWKKVENLKLSLVIYVTIVHLFQIFFDIPRALIEPDHWHQFWSKLVTQRTRNRGWKKEFDIIAF